MGASTVWVYAGVEANVRAVVAGDDRTRVIRDVYSLGPWTFFRLFGVDLYPLEAVLRVSGGPAPDDASA